jgi:DUF4097 and DUF4098 domain-containing protein YvlB
VESEGRIVTKGKPMKKAALLIAILSLVVATLAPNQMRVVDSYAATLQSSPGDNIQKPKGDELTEEFHQLYPLSPTGRVSIANINGDVHINVWDQGSVKVDAVKRAYSQQRLSEVTIDVTNTADSVHIKTRYPENQSYVDRNSEHRAASVEYTLTVPRQARLQGAELVNGSLDIEGLQGDVHASLVNGTVKAGGLGGEVKISTVNGAVEANVANLDSAKSVTVSSVNGSIVLLVPSGASADVKASTLHGAITNDFGLTVEDGQYVGHSLNGQIGSGGARVRLNNVNGPIAIKRG